MKRKKELIVVLTSLLVIVLSVSVAYFTTKILGTGKDVSVTSADLKVTFTSGSGTISGSDIEPGWSSGENTFTVKNETNGTYSYNIIIKDLVNTFVTEGFLQYKITSTDGGYTMADFADVPKSSTAYNAVIAQGISIAKNVTHTYKVEFKYSNSDTVDQSDDMGKTLIGKIFIQKFETTLASKLLENNPTISTRSNFSTPFTTNTEHTLYKATESGADVYYFAGVENIEGHCDYNGQNIYDSSKSELLTQDKCLSGMQVCKSDDNYLIYGVTSSCSGAYDGSNITLTNVTWVAGEEKPINNWVKLGNYYWRIIRTNADGSIRLLYSGTSPDTTVGYIGESAFNTTKDSPKYVGYMYGDSDTTLDEARINTNDSTIKAYIDNWYENNLTSYTNYLSNDAIYCNDREMASGNNYTTSSKYSSYFKPYERLNTNKVPSYDCTNNKDAFSGNNTEAKLKYSIALMTADEITYAGGVYNTNALMWYYTNSEYNSITGSAKSANWQLISPKSYSTTSNEVMSMRTNSISVALGGLSVLASNAVRPVTSLKSCVLWKSGNGSANSPYEIVENGGC